VLLLNCGSGGRGDPTPTIEEGLFTIYLSKSGLQIAVALTNPSRARSGGVAAVVHSLMVVCR